MEPARALTSPATTANPAPGFAGAGRLDGCVQGEEVGLRQNVGNRFGQSLNVLEFPGEDVDGLCQVSEQRNRIFVPFGHPGHDVIDLRHLTSDLLHVFGTLCRLVSHMGEIVLQSVCCFDEIGQERFPVFAGAVDLLRVGVNLFDQIAGLEQMFLSDRLHRLRAFGSFDARLDVDTGVPVR